MRAGIRMVMLDSVRVNMRRYAMLMWGGCGKIFAETMRSHAAGKRQCDRRRQCA